MECKFCFLPIDYQTKYLMLDDGQEFHDGCLKCSECQEEIPITEYIKRDGKIFHVDCYKQSILPNCRKCT